VAGEPSVFEGGPDARPPKPQAKRPLTLRPLAPERASRLPLMPSRAGADPAMPDALSGLTAEQRLRLQRFMNYRVAHPALVRVDAELSEVLADPGPTLLVLLVGPAGVGETTLLQALTARILEREAGDLRRNLARIPIAGISVIQTENGRFDEADYYRRALAALHEPLIQRKIAAHDFASDLLWKPLPRLASVADLRRLLERVWSGVGRSLSGSTTHMRWPAAGLSSGSSGSGR